MIGDEGGGTLRFRMGYEKYEGFRVSMVELEEFEVWIRSCSSLSYLFFVSYYCVYFILCN